MPITPVTGSNSNSPEGSASPREPARKRQATANAAAHLSAQLPLRELGHFIHEIPAEWNIHIGRFFSPDETPLTRVQEQNNNTRPRHFGTGGTDWNLLFASQLTASQPGASNNQSPVSDILSTNALLERISLATSDNSPILSLAKGTLCEQFTGPELLKNPSKLKLLSQVLVNNGSRFSDIKPELARLFVDGIGNKNLVLKTEDILEIAENLNRSVNLEENFPGVFGSFVENAQSHINNLSNQNISSIRTGFVIDSLNKISKIQHPALSAVSDAAVEKLVGMVDQIQDASALRWFQSDLSLNNGGLAGAYDWNSAQTANLNSRLYDCLAQKAQNLGVQLNDPPALFNLIFRARS